MATSEDNCANCFFFFFAEVQLQVSNYTCQFCGPISQLYMWNRSRACLVKRRIIGMLRHGSAVQLCKDLWKSGR